MNTKTPKRSTTWKPTAALLAVVFAGSMMGMNQPQDQPLGHSPDQDTHRQNDADKPPSRVLEISIDADALRARLTRSVQQAEKMISLHKEALTKLDEGASPSEVLSSIRLKGIMRRSNNAENTPNASPSRQNLNRQASSKNPENTRPTRMQPSVRLNAVEREEMHEFLREHLPELWTNIEPIAGSNPEGADRLLGRMAPKIQEIMLLSKSEPELAAIRTEEMHAGMLFVEASRVFRKARNDGELSEADQEKALAKLRRAATMRFNAHLHAKEFEIAKLQARLNDLKNSIDSVETQRDVEVSRMVNAAKLKPRRRDQSRPQSRDD